MTVRPAWMRPHRAMPQQALASVQSLPAPVGGWNARDSYANMEPTDAVQLTNLFPSVSSVNLRGGFSPWSTGLSGEVQTLSAYEGGTTEELWAFTSTGNLYNTTASGAVGAAAVTGLTNGWWEHTNITTPGGHFLYAANGFDDPLLYDGSTWTAINAISTPAITGVTTNTLSNVLLFKHRLWFIQKGTLKAWYLPTDAIAGVAQLFDLSAVATMGGYLVDMEAWTVDGGYGVDDNLAFFTSEGEMIVYRGTDPASSSTWAQMGNWSFGAPIGNRCMAKYGGDLLVLTQDGLVPMSTALQSSRVDPRAALSDKIQGAISAAFTSYAPTNSPDARGWQILLHPKQNALWVNIPVAVSAQQQYVMNTITKAWCNFTGWHANCWETIDDQPYFGTTGTVCKAWDDTYADNGTDINGLALQAFNYFGARGVKKYFTRAHLAIFTNGTPSIGVGMNVDFELADMTAPLTFLPSTFGLWDVGLWDVALWGSGLQVTNTWLGITGIGYCGGLQFKTASQGTQIQWASTDVVYQQGWAGV